MLFPTFCELSFCLFVYLFIIVCATCDQRASFSSSLVDSRDLTSHQTCAAFTQPSYLTSPGWGFLRTDFVP